MPDQIRVVAAVISRGDELLVCQRPPHKRHGGLWEFPGGKCEPGESDADAIRRELAEELGVARVTVGEPQFEVADPGSAYLIISIAVSIEDEPRAVEHRAITWATTEALRRLPLAPNE